MSAIVNVRDVHKKFGENEVLRGVSFEIERGQVVAIIGPTIGSGALAMLPLALGLGKGGEAQAPLATVVIGGLLVSTLVTLVLVPVVYTIFDDWGQKLGKRRARSHKADDTNIVM